jgi:excisionase family DNA binding protein
MTTPSLRLLTIKAAAAQLGVPVATVYRLVAERLIAHTRLVGGQHPRIYLREADLVDYVDRCRVPAEAPFPARRVVDESWRVPASERRFS